MISIDSQKSDQQILKIQRHEKPAQNLINFLSPEELKLIHQIKDRAFSIPEFCAEKHISPNRPPLGTVAHPKFENLQALDQLLRPKLQTHLEEPFDLHFSFHKNFFPYGIHTDSGYFPDEIIYKQGIIPLEVFPNDADVYTVIFKQKCYHSISFPRELKTIANLTHQQIKVLHHWDPNKNAISEKARTTYWDSSPETELWLKGFEIELPFLWKMGNMALWDRAHLHCSSDFSNHGIQGKIGLMWISSKSSTL